MVVTRHHLAHCNVAQLLAPLDTPSSAGFVDALEPVNALADRSPGLVWRLPDPTSIRAFDDDDLILINVSVWESAEALAEFTYRSGHRDVMRQRRQWFGTMDEAQLVLWWVPAGHVPDVEEAKDRLGLLRRVGPSPDAFTFRSFYPVDATAPISVAPPPGNVTLGRIGLRQ
ncbi:MAG: hypothetical protein QOE93_324 [Actinomycetota bacterium]|jgi:heme-degrading monooxygenase HmoA|nr:hypothetical protein [Actinomycetota bacterium]